MYECVAIVYDSTIVSMTVNLVRIKGSQAPKALRRAGGVIEILNLIGSGGFGKVYFGYDIKSERKVAVKVIDKERVMRQGLKEYVEREIEMMRTIRNKHIISLLEAIETSTAYNLVMELAENGELFDKIVQSQRFDETTARKYFQQLINAVHYCHKINIAHRDLKAENLLLGADNELKICDFGLSRYTREGPVNDSEIMFTSMAGSIDYQAPEVLRGRGYEGCACDMWSCGCILFFMLCGYLPFTDDSDGLTRKRIMSCHYNSHNRYLSDSASDLIAQLLQSDPASRYTTCDVINHPWFRVNLDPQLFPEVSLGETPHSFALSEEFIQRALSPNRNHSFAMEPNSPTLTMVDELHGAFRSCNIGGDGLLNREEVRDALIKLNNNCGVSDEEVTRFMNNFQQDSAGRITEEEFIMGWTRNQNALGKKYNLRSMVNLFHYDLRKEFLQDLRRTFDIIDTEHSGIITLENVHKIGLGLPDEEILSTLKSVNGTPDDSPPKTGITFEQFVQLCLKYDLMKTSALGQRLRRLEGFFSITEYMCFKGYLHTGFTVAGGTDTIKAHLIANQKTLQTNFDVDGIDSFLYGQYTEGGKKMLEVGVRLLGAVPGYTKVVPYRIRGKTSEFHKWFLSLRKSMREQLLRYEEDTAIQGQPELM